MSVLIDGMEIPKACTYCRFSYDQICHALQKTFSENYKDLVDGKFIDCPLQAIPAKHGRLIDADRLIAVLKSTVPYEYRNSPPFPEIIKMIENQPTIIEAEDGK